VGETMTPEQIIKHWQSIGGFRRKNSQRGRSVLDSQMSLTLLAPFFEKLSTRHPMLYRGINKQADEANAGRLLPKGTSVEVVPKVDGKWKFDGKFRCGPCESNTARAHQIESGLYGGCGISTSRSERLLRGQTP
jgi:hypothetical protein